MAWQGIEGHDAIVERFRASLARGRLASTYLFLGPRGIGKRAFALRLAQALLCPLRPVERLEPCGTCPACQQVSAGTHPDLLWVAKPADKSFIPLELFIGPKEKRMQQGLCHDIGLKPAMGGRRVAIVDDADYLNEEGANCLLKTLEEPPPRSVMILIGTSADRQLPTIRSRAQTIRFRPLGADTIARLLVAQGAVETAAEAARLATYCDGSLEQAREMADPALWAFRGRLLHELSRGGFDSVAFAKPLAAVVEEAGKEAALRRVRMRQIIGFAIDFYRQVVRQAAGADPSDDVELQAAVAKALGAQALDEPSASLAAERCLEALGHVDRNANQSALLECWLDDLGRIALGAASAATPR